LRVVNLPQDFEEADDPGIRPVEDLELRLRRLFQNSANKENDILLLVDVTFHQKLFHVDFAVINGSVASERQDTNEGAQVLHEFLDDDIGLRALDDLVKFFFRNQYNTLQNVNTQLD
jgi:hypothetical protein